ncbi:metal ABC transporter permease [Persicirhabdus sediminis]|uniref:Metal ABC transporter permease n=1 Tax=Persicirhabdus sediminis TaxID=454144 RepID=A0A8J7MDW2_9BACT|nr:metal ABC transporter permease [Persicirhabdus sediminis]MBK1790891.1 metal ABC transporter permease [Persicirhabdus sediminis]
MRAAIDLLEFSYFQRALIAAILIGFTNGFFSGFVLLRRNALSLSALSHTMLPGIVVMVLLTGVLSQTNAFLGALLASLIVGLSSYLISKNSRIPQGTALTIFYTTAFAIGISLIPKLSIAQEMDGWLFGNILAVSNGDLWTFFLIAMVTLLSSTTFMRPLLITLFEPNVAAAQGVPVRWMNCLLYSQLILALVGSYQAVGSILSIGLLVAPAAIVSLFTNKTSLLFWGGGIIGALSSALAIFISVPFDLPTGPAIVIVLGLIFIISVIFSSRYGLGKLFSK